MPSSLRIRCESRSRSAAAAGTRSSVFDGDAQPVADAAAVDHDVVGPRAPAPCRETEAIICSRFCAATRTPSTRCRSVAAVDLVRVADRQRERVRGVVGLRRARRGRAARRPSAAPGPCPPGRCRRRRASRPAACTAKHGMPTAPAAASTAPRAWPTAKAVRTLRPKKMSSTASAAGRCAAISSSSAAAIAASRRSSGWSGAGRDHAAAERRRACCRGARRGRSRSRPCPGRSRGRPCRA